MRWAFQGANPCPRRRTAEVLQQRTAPSRAGRICLPLPWARSNLRQYGSIPATARSTACLSAFLGEGLVQPEPHVHVRLRRSVERERVA